MSAPLVVNTRYGMCWTRRVVTSSGIALYAPEGVCSCPSFVMATLEELAEHGIVGSADVLPVPANSVPQLSELERLRRALTEACDEVARLESELGGAVARVAELEALTPAAIQTCRKCGAGYTYGEPCSTCEFRARMADELQARGLDGEHYAAVHHAYRTGRDLPETGGAR